MAIDETQSIYRHCQLVGRSGRALIDLSKNAA